MPPSTNRSKVRLSDLAADLRPYLVAFITEAGVPTGGSAPSPHDLSSAHHSGAIGDSQAPQFLKTDGTRQLTGNLLVSSLVTIDGVDISALKSDFDTHTGGADPHSQYLRKATADLITAVHTFNPISAGAPFVLGANAVGQTITGLRADQLNKSISAGTGLTGGGALTADRTLAIDLAANLTWTGNETFEGGLITRSIMPQLSDAYDLGSVSLLWRSIFASELDTFLLKENAISVVGGMMMIGKNQGSIAVDLTNAQTTIDFGTAMTANDIVLFRTAGQVEYLQIVSLVSGTNYNVTRNLDGSGANSWPAGSVWFNLGYNGTGRIEFDAISTPRISIKRQGTAYNTLLTEPVRLGDLNGWDTVGTERYGIGLGDFSGGNYLRYEPGSGFIMKTGDGAVTLDDQGISFSISNIYNTPSAIKFFNGADLITTMYAMRDASPSNQLVSMSSYPSLADSDYTAQILLYSNAIGPTVNLGAYDTVLVQSSQLVVSPTSVEFTTPYVLMSGRLTVSEHVEVPYLKEYTGWQKAAGTWTYSSATTFLESGNVVFKYSKGTRVSYVQSGSTKYGYVINATYSSPNTTVTVTGGSDYTIANAAITDPRYSYEQSPQNFPNWFNYTPIWTGSGSNPAIGNGTLKGRFSIQGRICIADISVTMGSTTTYGSGDWSLSLPVQAFASGYASNGLARCYDTSTGQRHDQNVAVLTGATTVIQYVPQEPATTVSRITPTVPFTWATGDIFDTVLPGYSI